MRSEPRRRCSANREALRHRRRADSPASIENVRATTRFICVDGMCIIRVRAWFAASEFGNVGPGTVPGAEPLQAFFEQHLPH
jgi:hypothetical protein